MDEPAKICKIYFNGCKQDSNLLITLQKTINTRHQLLLNILNSCSIRCSAIDVFYCDSVLIHQKVSRVGHVK